MHQYSSSSLYKGALQTRFFKWFSYRCCGASDVRRITRRCFLLIVWTLSAAQHAQHLPPRVQGHQYLTAALSRRERERAVSNLTSTYCRRKKNRNMHYFLCACQQKCERRKGKEEFLLCRKSEEEWVRQPCLVPLVSNKPKLEEKESEISYHREK